MPVASPKFFPHICILFTLAVLGSVRYSGQNPSSRFALMASICAADPRIPMFAIDTYTTATPPWTLDYAQPPSGHRYTNKAPGPSLLAAPLLCWIDPLLRPNLNGENYFVALDLIFSFLFQLLPMLIVCGMLLRQWPNAPGGSFATYAFLLGTTATVFMGSFFGHAFSAVLLAAFLLALLRQHVFALGFLTGLAVLSDYATVFCLPAIGGALWFTFKGHKNLLVKFLRFGLGALPWALLWIYYHEQSFGSFLNLPQKFQNPIFTEARSERIWGVINFLPDLRVLRKLLLSGERGLIITQPWILLLAYGAWKYRAPASARLKVLQILSWGSLAGLLWMNASFNGWHGGAASGPRYLSPALPLFAFLALELYPRFSARFRSGLWLLLIYTVLFNLFILSTNTIAGEGAPLWVRLWDSSLANPTMSLGKFFILTLGLFYGLRTEKIFSGSGNFSRS